MAIAMRRATLATNGAILCETCDRGCDPVIGQRDDDGSLMGGGVWKWLLDDDLGRESDEDGLVESEARMTRVDGVASDQRAPALQPLCMSCGALAVSTPGARVAICTHMMHVSGRRVQRRAMRPFGGGEIVQVRQGCKHGLHAAPNVSLPDNRLRLADVSVANSLCAPCMQPLHRDLRCVSPLHGNSTTELRHAPLRHADVELVHISLDGFGGRLINVEMGPAIMGRRHVFFALSRNTAVVATDAWGI